MKRIHLLFFLSLAMVLISARGSDARPWRARDNLHIKLRYLGGYESNFLELSSRDLDRFDQGRLGWSTQPETYDDFVQNLALNVSLSSPRILKRKTRVYYTFSRRCQLRNSFNNRSSHSFFFLQDIYSRWDLIAGYFFIPDRYLRDYYDRDTGSVLPASFDYHLWSGGLRYTVPGKWRIDIRYEGFQVYYDPHFTEYDSEGFGIRINGRYDLNRSVRLEVELRKRWSDNVGYDSSVQTAAIDPTVDAEFGNGDYGEEWFQYGVIFRNVSLKHLKGKIHLSHLLRHRYYTSDLPLMEDAFHRGREHLLQLFKADWTVDLPNDLSIRPEFSYELRRTDSPLPAVPEVKDYDNLSIKLFLEYQIW